MGVCSRAAKLRTASRRWLNDGESHMTASRTDSDVGDDRSERASLDNNDDEQVVDVDGVPTMPTTTTTTDATTDATTTLARSITPTTSTT